jgi:hypothetical protein
MRNAFVILAKARIQRAATRGFSRSNRHGWTGGWSFSNHGVARRMLAFASLTGGDVK